MLVVVAFDGTLPLGFFDGLRQFLAFLGDDRSPQILAQQHVERLGQLARDRAVVVDQQPLEEREVEVPSHRARCFAVGRLAVAHSGESAVHVGFGCLEVALDGHETAFDGGDFGRNPGLLALEQVERDRVGVVCIEQLLTLAFEFAQPALLRGAFAGGVGAELG